MHDRPLARQHVSQWQRKQHTLYLSNTMQAPYVKNDLITNVTNNRRLLFRFINKTHHHTFKRFASHGCKLSLMRTNRLRYFMRPSKCVAAHSRCVSLLMRCTADSSDVHIELQSNHFFVMYTSATLNDYNLDGVRQRAT